MCTSTTILSALTRECLSPQMAKLSTCDGCRQPCHKWCCPHHRWCPASSSSLCRAHRGRWARAISQHCGIGSVCAGPVNLGGSCCCRRLGRDAFLTYHVLPEQVLSKDLKFFQ